MLRNTTCVFLFASGVGGMITGIALNTIDAMYVLAICIIVAMSGPVLCIQTGEERRDT